MRNLHDISLSALNAYIWYYVFGGNGRSIGSVNGVRVAHSYLTERGTPPPIGDRFASRRYWHIFQRGPENREDVLRPACGRLRSQSRYPYASQANSNSWSTPRLCPNCLDVRPDTMFAHDLRANDPWTFLSSQERDNQVDPVSGV
jgi:hypothetical protein